MLNLLSMIRLMPPLDLMAVEWYQALGGISLCGCSRCPVKALGGFLPLLEVLPDRRRGPLVLHWLHACCTVQISITGLHLYITVAMPTSFCLIK